MQLRSSVIATQTAGDKTFGSLLLTGIHPVGNATASTMTLLDGTAIKFAILIAVTATPNYSFVYPYAFTNLIVDMTGDANYSIAYIPVP